MEEFLLFSGGVLGLIDCCYCWWLDCGLYVGVDECGYLSGVYLFDCGIFGSLWFWCWGKIGLCGGVGSGGGRLNCYVFGSVWR